MIRESRRLGKALDCLDHDHRQGIAVVVAVIGSVALPDPLAYELASLHGPPVHNPMRWFSHLGETGFLAFEPHAMSFKKNSFPSGHATSLFALAAFLVLLAPRWRVAVFGAAGIGALSRVGVGAHHLSDVVAGSVFGYAGARAMVWLAGVRGWVADVRRMPRARAAVAQASFRRLRRGVWMAAGQTLRRFGDRVHGLIRQAAALRGRGPHEERVG